MMKSIRAGRSMYTISVPTTPNSEGSRTEIQVMVKKEFQPNPKCFPSFSNSGWRQILHNKVNFMVKVYYILLSSFLANLKFFTK